MGVTFTTLGRWEHRETDPSVRLALAALRWLDDATE